MRTPSIRHFQLPCFIFVRIPIHRAVLTAASKYFLASLGPNFKEGSKTEFDLDDTDGETLKAIVEFCYTGCIELTGENVAKFLAFASSVELDLLEKKCWRFYDEKLTVTSSTDTLIFADKYSDVNLRQKAFDLICESFESVPAEDILRLDHQLLQEILKCDKVQATEECVLKRLLEWFAF